MARNQSNSAVADEVNENYTELRDSLAAAIKVIRAEMRNTTGEASDNARTSLAALREYKNLQRAPGDASLSPEDATRLLQAVNESQKQIAALQQANSVIPGADGVQGMGTDGKTITERTREQADKLATQESVVKILQAINERKEDAAKEKEAAAKNLKTTLRQGLSAFLGPAGPLIELASDLKEEYGEDAKAVAKKLKRWLGLEKDLISEFEKDAERQNRRSRKLFDMLGDRFSRLGSLLKGGIGGMFDNIGGLGKRAGRFLKRGAGAAGRVLGAGARGAGRVLGGAARAGGSLLKRGAGAAARVGGKAAAGLGKMAGGLGKMGSGLLKIGGKLLGPLAIGFGIAGIVDDKDAGADPNESGFDKGVSYASGAATGASAGATIGSIIPGAGTVAGAAIGAVVGLIFTGISRNWTSISDSLAKTWGGVTKSIGTVWGKVSSMGTAFVAFQLDMQKGLREGFEKTVKWLRDNIPGFSAIMDFAGKVKDKAVQIAEAAPAAAAAAGAAVSGAAGAAGAAISGAAGAAVNGAAGVAGAAGAAVSGAVQTGAAAVTGAVVDAKVAVAGAAQTGANAVSAGAAAVQAAAPGTAVATAVGALGKGAQSAAAFTGKLAMPNAEIKGAILGAAKTVGVDPGYMMAMTAQESSFNPNAQPNNSSAKGLNQFIDKTWKGMVNKYGKEYGIGMNDQFDPKKNAMMGALFARDNAKGLTKQGHEVNSASLYAAHMLGGGGANTLLSALKSNPKGFAADSMPDAAAKNHNVFYNRDGSKKTNAEVHKYYQDHVESKAEAYNNALNTESKSDTQTANSTLSKSDTRVANNAVSKSEVNNKAVSKSDAMTSNSSVVNTGGSRVSNSLTAKSDSTTVSTVGGSIAPQSDAYTRASSASPSANIEVSQATQAVDPSATAPPAGQSGGGISSGGRTRAQDIPFVLGDNHMVVINAGMMGA